MKPSAHRALQAAVRVAACRAVVVCLAVLAFFGLGPHTGLYRTMTVLSGSMVPRFSPGDVVVVTPEPMSALRVGQIITYSTPVAGHPIVTHRVVAILSGGPHPVVRTRGDANNAPDPWTARLENGPVWKVSAVIPKAGWAIEWLRQPWLRLLLVLVVPALLAGIWLRDIWGAGEALEEGVEGVAQAL
ncbi:MAG: signal peptidase I [Gaiellales bacterium]